MICPLCRATLVESTIPTSDNLHSISIVECPTDLYKNKFSHYSNDDYYGIKVVVLPYILEAKEGDGWWFVTEVDSDGIPCREITLPMFKIPPMNQFLDKLKLLLVFS